MAIGQREIEGKVQSFNLSPKGMFEGMLVQTAKELVQINFPPEAGSALSARIAAGAKIKALVEPQEDHRPAEHPVFDLVQLRSPKAEGLNLTFQPEQVSVEGKVSRMNFARHGERNGAILENGDFVHLKPGGAKAVALDIGITLSVQGETEPSYVGGRVIEAQVVNGIQIKDHHATRKSGHAVKKHGTKKHGPKKHK